MAEARSTRLNPQKAQGAYAPLEILVRGALRRFGEMSGRIDPELMLLMIEYANKVIEDLKQHPYWSDAAPAYYISQTDVRPVPDAIMQAGLLAYLSVDQSSNKAQTYYSLYTKTMNQILYDRRYGNGPISLMVGAR